MAYVDKEYYENEYKGTPVPSEQFDRWAERAGEIIDDLTFGRVSSQGLDHYHPNIQGLVKKAVCAQIEHFAMNGGYEAVIGGGPSQVAIGSFSYNGGNGDSREVASPSAIRHLSKTGLMYAGLGGMN